MCYVVLVCCFTIVIIVCFCFVMVLVCFSYLNVFLNIYIYIFFTMFATSSFPRVRTPGLAMVWVTMANNRQFQGSVSGSWWQRTGQFLK